ncbi:hypothetical protein GCM10022393_04600 [Aquimarina addita]|uniref:Ankyrin repeat domain-containing protein n=1 Tax=Aquimarina addita TaxID=870485 RepID=A0ABP7X9P1_9FLAO
MKKTIVIALMILFIAPVSFAMNKQTTMNTFTQELATKKLSPFCMAIVKGDLETVKKFIELGSDVNESSEGMTPLMYAARYNRLDIMRVLINEGAKINVKSGQGFTAMKYAKLSNASEAVALLKELS